MYSIETYVIYMYVYDVPLSPLLSLSLSLSPSLSLSLSLSPTQSRLPKAATSLKVLAELPIIVVLMYQVLLS